MCCLAFLVLLGTVGCTRIERPDDLVETPIVHWEHLPEQRTLTTGEFVLVETIDLEADAGFRIDTQVRFEDAHPNFSIALIFGATESHHYRYTLTRRGTYAVSILGVDNKELRPIRPTALPFDVDFNIPIAISVERVRDSLFLYCEGTLVDKLRLPYDAGTGVGYAVSGEGTLILEAFIVTRLDPPPSPWN